MSNQPNEGETLDAFVERRIEDIFRDVAIANGGDVEGIPRMIFDAQTLLINTWRNFCQRCEQGET
jgi:hypothetical protein